MKGKTFPDNIKVQYRVSISLLFATVVFLSSRHYVGNIISYMFTWIAFAGSTLLFFWHIILTSHPRRVRSIAREEDNSRLLTFLFVLLAAFTSIFAIIFLLQMIPNETKRGLTLHILLATVCFFCSWVLIHTLFTLRYAHLYYRSPGDEPGVNNIESGGLIFPGGEQPDYLDFAYFSFVVGMTFQVSDVNISGRHIRRLALLHGFLSFVYNTVIVALSINILSGVIAR